MPTETEIWDWDHRYDLDTRRPIPAEKDIDQNWRQIKSIVGGEGAFNGGIDLVKHKDTKELAVRKRLRPHKRIHEHDYMRWRREMLILRRLRHHNIPYFIDGFYTPEKGSIYMHACRLGSLSMFADGGVRHSIPPKTQEFFLWYVLHQVAEAVLYLQTGFSDIEEANRSKRDKVKGWVTLVHGDIRMDQIFLDTSKSHDGPRVLLGDFGFGQFIKPWHRTEVHDGPLCKSSSKPPEFPEEISEATDVFGLGATAQLYITPPDVKVKAGLSKGWLTKFNISRTLDELVCDCVSNKASNRPSIRVLLTMLECKLNALAKDGYYPRLIADSLFKALY
jgi:serine/threonine protein kinase